jgi:hypothetical protein
VCVCVCVCVLCVCVCVIWDGGRREGGVLGVLSVCLFLSLDQNSLSLSHTHTHTHSHTHPLGIDFMIRWHQQFMGKEYLLPDNQLNPRLLGETGAPNKYGIHRAEQLVETCLPGELIGYIHPRSRI